MPSQPNISFWPYLPRTISRVHVHPVRIRCSLKGAFATCRSSLFSDKASFLWKQTLGPCVWQMIKASSVYRFFFDPVKSAKEGKKKKPVVTFLSAKIFNFNKCCDDTRTWAIWVRAGKHAVRQSSWRKCIWWDCIWFTGLDFRSSSHMWGEPFSKAWAEGLSFIWPFHIKWPPGNLCWKST